MAAAKIAAVDFNKMTSKWRHLTGLLAAIACGHVHWWRSACQSTASNGSAVLIGREKCREYLICLWYMHSILSVKVCDWGHRQASGGQDQQRVIGGRTSYSTECRPYYCRPYPSWVAPRLNIHQHNIAVNWLRC